MFAFSFYADKWRWHNCALYMYLLFQKLHTIHTGFHSELQKAVSERKGKHHSIGECFTKWKQKFLIYGEFCSNLTKAQDLVDELCRRNPLIQSTVDVSQYHCRWPSVFRIQSPNPKSQMGWPSEASGDSLIISFPFWAQHPSCCLRNGLLSQEWHGLL